MATPLPARTAANDALISSTPWNLLTDRQKQYADLYGLTLQPPSPAPSKGAWMDPGTSYTSHPVPTNLDDNVTLPVAPALPGSTTGAYVGGDMAPVDTTAKDAANRDALALIKSTLLQYGLPDTLADWAWGEIVAGKGMAEIMLDLRQRPEFKAEFPEIDELQRKGLAPMSPGDIVSYRKQAREMMRAAGLPEGFYDNKNDFTKFIVNGVSAAELGDRINLAAEAAYKAPQDVRDTLAQWGVGPGDMTAFWLNPDLAQPLLERKYAAAQLAGAATRTGFGQLAESEAIGLTQLGVTADQAQTGFGRLAESRELFNPLEGGEDVIGRSEQMDAVFRGNSTNVARIEQRRRRRQARFEAGGTFAAERTGVSGLGAAPRT